MGPLITLPNGGVGYTVTPPNDILLATPGPPGGRGLPGDYGYVRYGEMMGAVPLAMSAETDTPFVVRAPQTIGDSLKPPFVGFSFLDAAGILRCRKAGDSYLLSIRLSVTPLVIGGWFSMSLLIAGNLTGLSSPTSTRKVPLSGEAGEPFRFDELFQVFPSTGFATGGAKLVMRSSVPVTLSDDVVYITPVVCAP